MDDFDITTKPDNVKANRRAMDMLKKITHDEAVAIIKSKL